MANAGSFHFWKEGHIYLLKTCLGLKPVFISKKKNYNAEIVKYYLEKENIRIITMRLLTLGIC